MKIVLDISMTEYTALLSKVTDGAKAQVELDRAREELYASKSQVSSLTYSLERSKESVTSERAERKYYSDRCDQMAYEIRTLQEQLRVANAPKPKYTLEEMGKLLATVRDAMTKEVSETFLPGDAYFNNLVVMAKGNQKIGMIKLVREGCVCGLKEAKDLVEAIVWDMYATKLEAVLIGMGLALLAHCFWQTGPLQCLIGGSLITLGFSKTHRLTEE